VDPLVIDKAVDRYRRGKRTLTAACEHYGVELTTAHDAGADAVAAGRVAQAIARAFPEVAAVAVAELHARQVDWCREQAESYQQWRRANGEPEFTTPARGRFAEPCARRATWDERPSRDGRPSGTLDP
jgi:DNA polymerase-3 subunit epsilon